VLQSSILSENPLGDEGKFIFMYKRTHMYTYAYIYIHAFVVEQHRAAEFDSV